MKRFHIRQLLILSATIFGSLLAAESTHAQMRMWIADADGSNQHKVTDMSVVWTAGDWSPDGEWILFIHDEGTSRGLWKIHPDGSGASKIVAVSSDASGPRWSHDSKKVVYTDQNSIMVVNADGSGRHALIALGAGRAGVAYPKWSADGKWIYFVSYDYSPDRKGIKRIEAGGGGSLEDLMLGSWECLWMSIQLHPSDPSRALLSVQPTTSTMRYELKLVGPIFTIVDTQGPFPVLSGGAAATWRPPACTEVAYSVLDPSVPFGSCVVVQNYDGSNSRVVIKRTGYDYFSDWSPDGGKILYFEQGEPQVTPTPTARATPTLAPTATPTRVPTATATPTIAPTPAATPTPRPPMIPYFTDFEAPVGGEWSLQQTDTTPVGGRRFLGLLNNAEVELSLAPLGPHHALEVSFDLYVVRSWDGNEQSANGPDILRIVVDNSREILSTTFCNQGTYPDSGQAYPGSYPGGSYPPRTGAAEQNTLGYIPCDTVYHISRQFGHTTDSLTLRFSATLPDISQGIANEAWGIDNVRVKVPDTAVRAGEWMLY